MSAPDRLGFSRNLLLRDAETRTEATLPDALGHPDAAVYLRAGADWLCGGTAEAPEPLFSLAKARVLLAGADPELLLGHDRAGAPRFAATVPAERFGAPSEPEWPGAPRETGGFHLFDLRTLGMRELLPVETESELASAAHLLNWHENARFCGRCGGPTVAEAAGLRRRCTRCDHIVFPRTDPVAIMLVHDGEGRCLMARAPRFPPTFWSCLAGFIEAGETIEDAVRRETLEEAAIAVGEVRYRCSQPWPFPGSLMIGCTARATSREIRFDGVELADCRWFGRDETRRMLDGTHPDGLAVPPRYAIAHHLIRAFAEGREDEI